VSERAQPPADRGDLKSTAYEFFILAMAVLSIVNLALAILHSFRSQSWWLVLYIETILTIVFVTDFVYRLRTARSKRGYFFHGGGVFDLLSCGPLLRIFRLFRIVRAVRIVRRLGGRRVFRELRTEIAAGVLYLLVFVGVTVLEFVGLLELRFEQYAAGANITTAGDALWWGYVTATTVGYGDYYPVTTGGRLAGIVMLTVGVALFATFSGFLANLFLSPRTRPPAAGTSDAVKELRVLVEQQEATTALLREKLDALELAR
jgi:voltage-gated potassium channel